MILRRSIFLIIMSVNKWLFVIICNARNRFESLKAIFFYIDRYAAFIATPAAPFIFLIKLFFYGQIRFQFYVLPCFLTRKQGLCKYLTSCEISFTFWTEIEKKFFFHFSCCIYLDSLKSKTNNILKNKSIWRHDCPLIRDMKYFIK